MNQTISSVSRAAAFAVSAAASDIFWRVLDEIDYGLIVVQLDGRMLHANHLARYELARGRYLHLADGLVSAPAMVHRADLQRGIASAGTGRRCMLEFSGEEGTMNVAFVPLSHPFEGDTGAVLLMLERRPEDNLALSFFARAYRITPMEESVLRLLNDGLDVDEVAGRLGIAISTVRSHIRALREKTRANSIRGLLQRVATLPPVVTSLRSAPFVTQNGAARPTSRDRACPSRPSPSYNRNSPAGASDASIDRIFS